MAKLLTDSYISDPNSHLGEEELDEPHFDSELIVSGRNATTNADLIITLKIHFVAAATWFTDTHKDSDGNVFPIREWEPADNFSAWCKTACRLAEKTWNEQLWLKTPSYFTGLDYTENSLTYRPNIHCGFRCVEASSPSEAHCRVSVVRLDTKRATEQGLGDFRSNFVLWDHRDIEVWGANYEGDLIRQTTVCHEVGHLLGLHHIGEVKSVKGCFLGRELPWAGINPCYGGDDPNPSHANNIMGLGMQVTSANALPWQREMCKYANALSGWYFAPEHWQAYSSRVAPERVYPNVSESEARSRAGIKEPSPHGIYRGSI